MCLGCIPDLEYQPSRGFAGVVFLVKMLLNSFVKVELMVIMCSLSGSADSGVSQG